MSYISGTFHLAYILFLVLSSNAAFATGQEHIGETADYELDSSRNRTSLSIKEGTGFAEVVGWKTEAEENLVIDLDYLFRLRARTEQEGKSTFFIENQYFTEEFFVQLRKTKHHATAHLKIKHIGRGTARDRSGKVYRNCDILVFYDIKESSVQDLEVTAFVSRDVPVLGAVTLDLRGKMNRVSVRAGLDLVP